MLPILAAYRVVHVFVKRVMYNLGGQANACLNTVEVWTFFLSFSVVSD